MPLGTLLEILLALVSFNFSLSLDFTFSIVSYISLYAPAGLFTKSFIFGTVNVVLKKLYK